MQKLLWPCFFNIHCKIQSSLTFTIVCFQNYKHLKVSESLDKSETELQMQQNPRKYYFALAAAVQQRICITTDHQFAWNLRSSS